MSTPPARKPRPTDGGRSFELLAAPAAPAALGAAVRRTRWEIRNGTVLTGPPGGPLALDPHSPFLGDSAHLIAAPRRCPASPSPWAATTTCGDAHASGQWATSFVLLPAGAVGRTPQVTSLAAFTQPLSTAVYMGTARLRRARHQDGGDDWIRADPGLPENVLALAADSSAQALYAATDQGLFVHHLQALPAPPVYQDASLYLRWLGIALVALLATAAAAVGVCAGHCRPAERETHGGGARRCGCSGLPRASWVTWRQCCRMLMLVHELS